MTGMARASRAKASGTPEPSARQYTLKPGETASYESCDLAFAAPGKQDAIGNPRAYVGDLKMNRKVIWKGVEQKISVMAASIPIQDRKEIRRGDKRQWYFTATLKIPNVRHKVRVVILWDQRRDEKSCKVLVTNRTTWEVNRILGVYRDRWTGTETFHRDGKQELGMGDCQLRETLRQTLTWAVDQIVTKSRKQKEVLMQLGLG